MQPLFLFESFTSHISHLTFHVIIFSSAEVAAEEAVVVSFVADFFVAAVVGWPVCLVDCPVAFVGFFVVAAAVVDFVAFFFYLSSQGCADLYVPRHRRIQVPLPAVLMK